MVERAIIVDRQRAEVCVIDAIAIWWQALTAGAAPGRGLYTNVVNNVNRRAPARRVAAIGARRALNDHAQWKRV